MAKYQFAVTVRPQFLPEHSDPAEPRFMFAYTVTIKNTGDAAAQLISRHWFITDGNNNVEEVEGEGVVGEQPVLQPGEAFEYTSGCVLEAALASGSSQEHARYQLLPGDFLRKTAQRRDLTSR